MNEGKGPLEKKIQENSIDRDSKELKGKESGYLTGSKKRLEGAEKGDDLDSREEIEKGAK